MSLFPSSRPLFPPCARWLRSRLIPGLRPRGSPGVVPVHRREPVAVRRAAVPGVEVPATAPDDPVRGLGRTRRVVGRRLLVVILVVCVPAPLPDVAVHVMKAEPVRKLLPHRVSHALQMAEPGVLVEVRGIASARVIPTRPPSADGIPGPSSPEPA